MTEPAQRNEAMRLHVLVSYAYWNSDRNQAILAAAPPEWNVMLDSGAFTSFAQGKPATPVDEYSKFCQEHSGRFWRIINLDRIGDGVTSGRNLQALHQAGVPAIPVFQRGDRPELLREMAQQGSPVCIGGISQNVGSAAEQAYINQVLGFVRKLGIKVHLLGVGGESLFRYHCWSGDSSSWEMGSRYGTMKLWSSGKMTTFSKSPSGRKGKGYIKPNLARTKVLAGYDLTWSDLREYRKWSVNEDSAVYLASIRSWIRLARSLTMVNKRYIFAAQPGHLGILARAWELEKHKWQK